MADDTAGGNMPVTGLPQSQIDAIIRAKRKVREPKACYPCHARKVKCDRKLPCDGCIKRDHAELCTYERPLKKRGGIVPDSPSVVGSPEQQQMSGKGEANITMPRIYIYPRC